MSKIKEYKINLSIRVTQDENLFIDREAICSPAQSNSNLEPLCKFLNYSQKDDLEYLHNELNDLLNNVTTDEVEGGNEICDSISGVVSTCVYELGSTSTDYQTVLPTKDFAEIIEEFIEFVNSNNLDN